MIEYKVRRGYESEELLIEMTPKSADKKFLDVLFNSIENIGVQVLAIQDLWMNDEVLIHCESDCGNFVISKDIWDFVFIMAPENQAIIARIDDALSASGTFIRKL